MTFALRIEDNSVSHVGEVRSENEDSFVALREANVWLVADGMGGHTHGKYASQSIVTLISQATIPGTLDDACEAISTAVHAANSTIYGKSLELGERIGSTFVALVLRGDEFAVLWSGDSRGYVFRGGQLYQLTQDHTQVQAMIERGLLSPEEAANHPLQHVLVRAVGVEESLQIDGVRDRVEPSDVFLLCSDGLHGLVPDETIARIVARSGVAAADELIAECLARGAPDNVTVVIVAAGEASPYGGMEHVS